MQLALYRNCVALEYHGQPEAWVRVIQPDDSAYEVCRHCGFLRQVSTPPDLDAMKRAFVAAWPSLRDWRISITGQPERVARDLPDAPFVAMWEVAQGE